MALSLCVYLVLSEKEILDVIADSAENNTLLKRDTVFAQLNFCLQSGMFKLFSSVVSTGVTEKAKGECRRKEWLHCMAATNWFVGYASFIYLFWNSSGQKSSMVNVIAGWRKSWVIQLHLGLPRSNDPDMRTTSNLKVYTVDSRSWLPVILNWW